jgi:phage baseplate assembly protein V
VEHTPLEMMVQERVPSGLGGRWYGVYPATVAEIKNDPDGIGRVRLALPWAPDTGGERYEAWGRVATLMGGNNRGSWFVPDTGDEVLVAFEGGDPRRPYVLGGLWNGKDKPPEDNKDGKNNVRALKTRSGHVIRLTDTDGDEKIEIIDKTGKDSIVVSAKDKTVAITADADVTITSSNGKLKLSGNGVEITSKAAVKIEASQNMDLKAAGPQLNIKGSMVNIN